MGKWKCWVVLPIAASGILASTLGCLASDVLVNQYGYIVMMVVLASGSISICIHRKSNALLRSWPLTVRLMMALPLIILVIMDVKAGPSNTWTIATASLGVITALGFFLPSSRSK